ncbi:PilZ domain-containing protein [Stutzerimonas tarimensis]|uniref:PilZ domain-containing protein n=1 Tax=Stutzerimonas tarimensis TaxID=1507735 RepID=A0ABV7T973_9GAMM
MSQIDRSYSEKRDYIRMRVETPGTLIHGAKSIPIICLDLSATGMQIEANARLQVGDRVGVRIESGHDSLRGLDAEAEVVRVSSLDGERQSIGLTILSLR